MNVETSLARNAIFHAKVPPAPAEPPPAAESFTPQCKTYDYTEWLETLRSQAPPVGLKDRPISLGLAIAGGVSFSAGAAVVGHMIGGHIGCIAGGIAGLAGGALLGKELGDATYALNIPPTVLEKSSGPPSTAQLKVNQALTQPYSASAVDLVSRVVIAAVEEVSPQEMQDRMKAKYQTLYLMDLQGNWLVPELKPHAATLLPDDLDGAKLAAFVDKMAAAARDNPYLMNFLGKARGQEFAQLRARVEADGAEVLADTMAQAQVIQRLTSVMVDDHTLNEACRNQWRAVADSNPKMGPGHSSPGSEDRKVRHIDVQVERQDLTERHGGLGLDLESRRGKIDRHRLEAWQLGRAYPDSAVEAARSSDPRGSRRSQGRRAAECRCRNRRCTGNRPRRADVPPARGPSGREVPRAGRVARARLFPRRGFARYET